MLRELSDRERCVAGTRVLLTGAGGFIGSHLCERLLAAGAEVRALVHYNSRNDRGHLQGLQHDRLEVVAGDVCDGQFVRGLMAGCQIVLHLAALIAIPYSYQAPASYLDTNLKGTLHLLQAAVEQKVTAFVQTSTSEVYGSAQFLPMGESHPIRPQSPYAASKAGADQLALSFHYSFGLPVVVLRPFNTYGPRQSMRAVLPSLCWQALQGSTLDLGNLESRRDLTYVEDTCAGFILAALSPEAIGKTVNLGFGSNLSVGQMVDKVSKLLDKSLEIRQDERRLRPPSSEVDQLLSDNALARELLGWTPKVDLDRGILELLSWLRSSQTVPSSSYAL